MINSLDMDAWLMVKKSSQKVIWLGEIPGAGCLFFSLLMLIAERDSRKIVSFRMRRQGLEQRRMRPVRLFILRVSRNVGIVCDSLSHLSTSQEGSNPPGYGPEF